MDFFILYRLRDPRRASELAGFWAARETGDNAAAPRAAKEPFRTSRRVMGPKGPADPVGRNSVFMAARKNELFRRVLESAFEGTPWPDQAGYTTRTLKRMKVG